MFADYSDTPLNWNLIDTKCALWSQINLFL